MNDKHSWMVVLERDGSTLSKNETVLVLTVVASVLPTRAMMSAVGFIVNFVFPKRRERRLCGIETQSSFWVEKIGDNVGDDYGICRQFVHNDDPHSK